MTIELKEYIDIKEILTSGACFRFKVEEDGTITNVLGDRIVNIRQDNKLLTIKSSNYDNLEEVINEYFDLNRDYNKINEEIINKNKELEKVVNKCKMYSLFLIGADIELTSNIFNNSLSTSCSNSSVGFIKVKSAVS